MRGEAAAQDVVAERPVQNYASDPLRQHQR